MRLGRRGSRLRPAGVEVPREGVPPTQADEADCFGSFVSAGEEVERGGRKVGSC